MPILSNLHNSPRKRREKKEDELASKNRLPPHAHP